MIKKITIEFRYINKTACSRCKKTVENIATFYTKLKSELADLGVEISFRTRKLPLSKLSQSNSILINGKDITSILGIKSDNQSRCYGCSKIMKKPCKCRNYTYMGKSYSHITNRMIKEAVMKILE